MGSATCVAVLEAMAVSADNGTVDSEGRAVGSSLGSTVVEIIKTVVEVSMGSRVEEVAGGIFELADEEEGIVVLAFVVLVAGDCATGVVKLLSKEPNKVDVAAVAPTPSPFPPVIPLEGFELVSAKTLGQSTATASPENTIPINVSGNALVPSQALLMLTVKFLRKLIQSREHAWPSTKSDGVQAVNGVL